MQNEFDLQTVNDELISQYQELIEIFYAYSRSETKIDEKEAAFEHTLSAQATELEDLKHKLDAQNTLTKNLREKA